jgi:GH35 family endo-1,4-beta-xylanase
LPNRDPANTGVIGQADYTAWTSHYGQNGLAGTLNGSAIIMHGNGVASGNGWQLGETGNLSTYYSVPAGGANVAFTFNATGANAATADFRIGDVDHPFTIANGTNNYQFTTFLPAGLWIGSFNLNNNDGGTVSGRTLRLNTVSETGATIQNQNTDANALAASNSYIQNYRRGQITVGGFTPGQQVNVSLNHLGQNFHWASDYDWTETGMLTGTSANALAFQNYLRLNYNHLDTGNQMWKDTEDPQGSIDMYQAAPLLAFTQANGMSARLSFMLYDQQDPAWVTSLRNQAVNSSSARTTLRNDISTRINYWVKPYAAYPEMTIYNEGYNHGVNGGSNTLANIYGTSGIASIYNEAHAAAPNSLLWVNDYSALQQASGAETPNGGWDAAGYMDWVGKLRAAGAAIGGIGLEDYTLNAGEATDGTFMSGMQMAAAYGLPLEHSESGIYTQTPESAASKIVTESMTMAFGNPQMTGWTNWYPILESGVSQDAPNEAFYNANGTNFSTMTITAAGKAYQDLLGIQDWDGNPADGWTTQTTATADANGQITFNGYYGQYTLTSGGQTWNLNAVKGHAAYTLMGSAAPEPSTLAESIIVAVLVLVFVGASIARKR